MQDNKMTLQTLMLYLGQLEFNITDTKKTLESMEQEKVKTLLEINFLMSWVDDTTTDDSQSPVD